MLSVTVIDFKTDLKTKEKAIRVALTTWAHGMDQFLREIERRPEMSNISLVPNGMECGEGLQRRWRDSQLLMKYASRSLSGRRSSLFLDLSSNASTFLPSLPQINTIS